MAGSQIDRLLKVRPIAWKDDCSIVMSRIYMAIRLTVLALRVHRRRE